MSPTTIEAHADDEKAKPMPIWGWILIAFGVLAVILVVIYLFKRRTLLPGQEKLVAIQDNNLSRLPESMRKLI